MPVKTKAHTTTISPTATEPAPTDCGVVEVAGNTYAEFYSGSGGQCIFPLRLLKLEMDSMTKCAPIL